MILLTSPSSRRRDLLQQIGFRAEDDFVQIDMPINVDFHEQKPELTIDEAKRQVIEVSRLKVRRAVEERAALRVLNLVPKDTVVVGATTVVFLNGCVLGRPLLASPDLHRATDFPASIRQAEREARQMLTTLKGQDFLVMTGVVIVQGDNLHNELSRCVVTEARMKQFSHSDIERYIRTGEPLDKAGGFGIQERGVILFDKIRGSYSNVVGLPLYEFVELLRDPLFEGRVQFRISERDLQRDAPVTQGAPELKVVSFGDVNYDLGYNEFPPGFFSNLRPPGERWSGKLERGIGGAAALFAFRARGEGFERCSVLGVIAGDALGRYIEQALNEKGVQTLLPIDYGRRTSIVLMLRDKAEQSTLVSLVDTDQALSEDDVNRARPEIESADALFVSGYCLTDDKRKNATSKAMEWAKKANTLVVLDVTDDMSKAIDFAKFAAMTQGKVDVLASKISTILEWFKVTNQAEDQWSFVKSQIIPKLREYFPTLFLYDSVYSHEIIASPDRIFGPTKLDYLQRTKGEMLGYADERTARHLYQFLSPRLLLASASPRRFALLKQIVAKNKIEVRVSGHEEPYRDEDPETRVKRLALEKARRILSEREFSPSVEIILGADTEIVLDGRVVGRPDNNEEARKMLRALRSRSHQAITGFALIDTQNERTVVDCVSTQVKFKALSEEEIERYVQSGEPIGKAGACGIQGKGALFVEEIDGSYTNVVGLPLEHLSQVLDREMGMPIWDMDRVSNWNFPHSRGGYE